MQSDLKDVYEMLHRRERNWKCSHYSGSLRLGRLDLVEDAVHFCNLLLVFGFRLRKKEGSNTCCSQQTIGERTEKREGT